MTLNKLEEELGTIVHLVMLVYNCMTWHSYRSSTFFLTKCLYVSQQSKFVATLNTQFKTSSITWCCCFQFYITITISLYHTSVIQSKRRCHPLNTLYDDVMWMFSKVPFCYLLCLLSCNKESYCVLSIQ